MTQGRRRRGRKGESRTAAPDLRMYDVPPASAVTITRPDGTLEVVPAQKARVMKKPARQSRKRGPLICARCGQPIAGTPGKGVKRFERGKPVHATGACAEEKPIRPTKPDPASTLSTPRPRSGTGHSPYKNQNTRAVKESAWSKVTCPRCGAAPGVRCTVRTPKGTVVDSQVPHQERPQVVRRALAAAAAQKKGEKQQRALDGGGKPLGGLGTA
ncbi:hypothetical protein ABZ926_35750 [Streptomyces litmocidini]|uniref:zinc finger domain-containing protein n=1 Tax=Streptomyces litmocidini TaxID=67318 RepID=UPI0033C742F4